MATGIQLDYAVPSADLSDYISLFYRFCTETPTFSDSERADRAQFRFLLRGAGSYTFPDGHEAIATDVHLTGPTTGPRQISATAPLILFGAGVTPCGWATIIGTSASSITNRLLDATDLFGTRVTEARQALATAASFDAMVAIAEDLIRTLLNNSGGETLRFVRAVDSWLITSTSPELGSLLETTGLSRRQLERKCNHLYGMPPKLLARKYRALRAAVALILDGESMDDVLDRGFYDQSHLIREIKEFTGLTPRQLRSEPGMLAQATITIRHALGGQVGPLVSDA